MTLTINPKRRFTWSVVIVLTLINIAIYFTMYAQLGGDALSGHTKDGHYFVNSHGTITEVSAIAWTYSYLHTILCFCVNIPVVAAFGCWAISGHDLRHRPQPSWWFR